MEKFGASLNGLSISITNAALASGVGAMLDIFQTKLANGGRDEHLRFYFDRDRGGGFWNYTAKQLVGGAVHQIGSEIIGQYKRLLGGKHIDQERQAQEWYADRLLHAQSEEEEKYGSIKVNNGANSVLAFDDWGNVCYDALMLSIPVSTPVKVSVGRLGFDYHEGKPFESDHLVWYDTTALISISSDKNIIFSRVTGRDYSRKELISNGDISFSVSGKITSNMPDIYPTNEVQKFRQVMQYKGIIEVNNEVLDNWGIKKIVIKSFSLPSKEGNKSVQEYSFDAVGIQPDKEADVREDTIEFIDFTLDENMQKDDSLSWKNLLSKQLKNLAAISVDLASQGLTLAEGYLDDAMVKDN